ncbi:MAG: Outer membrane protein assembly factor BamD [Calditrichaeota bacterium]|nr:Outer membrane protein assembly factor BamD [Calditrichota bacterium]
MSGRDARARVAARPGGSFVRARRFGVARAGVKPGASPGPHLPVLVILALVATLLAAVPVYPQAAGEREAADPLTSDGEFLHARRLYQRGMYELAVPELERFLKMYPEHDRTAEAAALLANALREQARFDEARTAYELAAVHESDTTRTIELLHRAAEMDLALGDTMRAVRGYLAVTVLFPEAEGLPRTLLRASRLLVSAGRWAEAENTAGTLLRDYPGTPWSMEAHLLLAQAYAGRGDLPPAINEARGVIDRARDDSLALRAHLLAGRWELGRYDPVAAEHVWSEGLERGGPRALRLELAAALAEFARERGHAAGARDALETVAPGAADSVAGTALLARLGDIRFLLGRYDRALAAYDSLDSGAAEIELRRAYCLAYLGRHEQAFAAATAAAGDSGGYRVPALALAAQEARALNRVDTAGSLWLRALADAGDSITAAVAVHQAALAIRAEQPARALALLGEHESVASETPLADDLEWQRIELLRRLGRVEEAAERCDELARRWLCSPYAPRARELARDLRALFVQEDAEHELLALIETAKDGPLNAAQRLELARLNAEVRRDFERAAAELVPLLDGRHVPDSIRREAGGLYREVVWRRWRKETAQRKAGADGNSRGAVEAETMIYASLAGDTSRAMHDPDLAYRLHLLHEETLAKPSERVRFARAVWTRYLADHPGSVHAADARLRLARALLTRIGDEPSGALDSQAADQLARLAETGGALRNEALLRWRELAVRNDNAALADSLERVLLAGPDDPGKVEAAVGRLARGEELPDSLARWLAGEASCHPDVLDNLPPLADRLVEMGEAETADRLLATNLRMRPGDPAAVIPAVRESVNRFARARIAEAAGDTLAAMLAFEAYVRESPNGRHANRARLRIGEYQLAYNRWERAQPWFEQILADDDGAPRLQPIRRKMARRAFEQERFEQAREWARLAGRQESDPDSLFRLDELAIVSLYRAGRLSEARSEVRAFIGRYDDHDHRDEAVARFELEKGRYLSSQERYGEAMDSYKAILRKYEDTIHEPVARYEIARDYLEQDEKEKSFEMLLELANDEPDHPVMGKVYWLLGNYYASEGGYFDAFRMYEKVLADTSYRGSWPHVLTNQERAFKEAGFYDGALRAARKYLELYPGAEDAFDHRMNIALAYLELGQYDLAISQFRRASTMAGAEDQAACRFYIAEAMERSGRLKEAIGEYLRVVHLNRPTKLKWGVTALYNAAGLWERLGRPDYAVDLYEEIVDREGLGTPFGRKAQEQMQRLEMFEQ